MRVNGINFDKGMNGKGVTGGGIKPVIGFLIQFYNEDNDVLNLLILNENDFDKIKANYENKYLNQLNSYFDKDKQTRDFYVMDKVYNKVMQLYNKDPYSEVYKTEYEKYLKIRKAYYEKYGK